MKLYTCSLNYNYLAASLVENCSASSVQRINKYHLKGLLKGCSHTKYAVRISSHQQWITSTIVQYKLSAAFKSNLCHYVTGSMKK